MTDTDTLKCDVLKVAHHGSKYSSSSAFLKATAAKYGVICVGASNSYGHPTDTTLSNLKERLHSSAIGRHAEVGVIGLDARSQRSARSCCLGVGQSLFNCPVPSRSGRNSLFFAMGNLTLCYTP